MKYIQRINKRDTCNYIQGLLALTKTFKDFTTQFLLLLLLLLLLMLLQLLLL